MVTVYRCDGCGTERTHDGFLTAVGILHDGALVDDVELCGDCDPDDALDALVHHLDDFRGDGA